MSSIIPVLLFHLFQLLTTILSTTTPPYRPTDQILLNCGSESSTLDDSNRTWDGDARSKYSPPNIDTSSIASKPQEPIAYEVPYSTARIFQSQFAYNFPVLAGPKFLRLYFFSATYSGLNITQSSFTVTANGYTLLSNFSAYQFVTNDYNPSHFMKEFIINVEDKNLSLNLNFSPSPKSFAFVNGIEIVSMPDTLYFQGENVAIGFDNKEQYFLKNTTALENVYRFNVGSVEVKIRDDTGMFRYWSPDDNYFPAPHSSYSPYVMDARIHYSERVPAYTAPEVVYKTSRVMSNGSNGLYWIFPVYSGFHYLLRLHFCEIQLEVTKENDRIFTILINNKTAEYQADVIDWTGGKDIPYFKDYVTWVPDDGSHGLKNLNLTLMPSPDSVTGYKNALLNGLEIFKLGDKNRSLGVANSDPLAAVGPDAMPKKQKKGRKVSAVVLHPIIGGVTGVLGVVLCLSFLIFRRRRRVKDSGLTNPLKASWIQLSSSSKSTAKSSASGSSKLPSGLCRHFLLEEIKLATSNFSENFVIGQGGFGKVYRGYIDNSATAVAIKRLHSSSNQGAREFETEIKMLSTLRHRHLVSLIGYCDENGEMILVYDYMAHGTLRGHIYNSENPPLQWKDRLKIMIGAAKGLHYLHAGAKHMIIHRDVKSTNILLDEKWVAKVSDFGLSKIGPTGGANTHVSTVVKGSIGYLDPEYLKRQKLTEKSDVYSFGVVLFEVLCARPPIIPNITKIQVNLAEWGKQCYKKGTLEQIVDPNLEGQIAPECLSKYAEIANRCLMDKGFERPTMSDVVWSLEFALQLQEVAENRDNVGVVDDGGDTPMLSSSQPLFPPGKATNTEEDEDKMMFSGSNEEKLKSTTSSSSNDIFKSSGTSTGVNDKFNSQTVFSEFHNPTGR